jgi:hypothetical protein
MTLLATASGGTKPDTFSTREQKSNSLIGQLDALAILAASRLVPKNKVTKAINQLLEKRGSETIVEYDATPPSTRVIKKIVEPLSKMRDTDRKQGVTATEVQAFRGQSLTYFGQARTYENFLQR